MKKVIAFIALVHIVCLGSAQKKDSIEVQQVKNPLEALQTSMISLFYNDTPHVKWDIRVVQETADGYQVIIKGDIDSGWIVYAVEQPPTSFIIPIKVSLKVYIDENGPMKPIWPHPVETNTQIDSTSDSTLLHLGIQRKFYRNHFCLIAPYEYESDKITYVKGHIVYECSQGERGPILIKTRYFFVQVKPAPYKLSKRLIVY